MTNPSYTPGPWHVGQHDNNIVYADGGRMVANCNDAFDRITLTPAANARLIASAPELLDALKEVLFNSVHGNGLKAHWKAHDRARAAISKAESKAEKKSLMGRAKEEPA